MPSNSSQILTELRSKFDGLMGVIVAMIVAANLSDSCLNLVGIWVTVVPSDSDFSQTTVEFQPDHGQNSAIRRCVKPCARKESHRAFQHRARVSKIRHTCMIFWVSILVYPMCVYNGCHGCDFDTVSTIRIAIGIRPWSDRTLYPTILRSDYGRNSAQSRSPVSLSIVIAIYIYIRKYTARAHGSL